MDVARCRFIARSRSHFIAKLTVNKLLPKGQGLSPVGLARAATVELDWDDLPDDVVRSLAWKSVTAPVAMGIA